MQRTEGGDPSAEAGKGKWCGMKVHIVCKCVNRGRTLRELLFYFLWKEESEADRGC